MPFTSLAAAVDRYYERLDSVSISDQIEQRLDNHDHIFVVTAYNADNSVKWEEHCLSADEFHQAMHEVIREGIRYELDRVAFDRS